VEISEALKGKTPWNKGKTVEYSGDKHHAWIDGRSREKEQARSTEMKHAPYREWRRNVFKRDDYKCRECGQGGKLNGHHIKSYSKHPELKYDINNGITLCVQCHKKVNGKEHLFEKRFTELLKNEVNSVEAQNG
jgi:hypothetical protein